SELMFLSEAEKSLPWTDYRPSLEDTAHLEDSVTSFRRDRETTSRLEKIFAQLPGTPDLPHYLQSLLKIATAVGGIRDRDSLQWQLLGFLFDVFPAERGAVIYFDKNGGVESTATWDRLSGPEHPVPVDESLLQRVFAGKSALLAPLRGLSGKTEERSGSVLCVPMMTEKVLGAIYLHSSVDRSAGPFDQTHLQVLSAVGSIAALALQNLCHWERISNENRALRAEVSLEHNIVGASPRMKDVFEFVRRVAPTDATVLIEGESGTGKELVARAIHRNSARAENSFVAINCAAIAENLLESELFGHEQGAFTGAAAQKKGRIEMAEGGTLFLDEVSELAPELQAKLLRVLQEREFERVGGTRAIPLDIRLVAATNKKLAAAVAAGEFRKDLFYRLNVVTLTMPALRDRAEDIPQLAEHFLAKSSRKSKTRIKKLSDEARVCLIKYDWPGNVRELENAIESALVLGANDTILPEDLPEAVLEAGPAYPDEHADESGNYLRSVKENKRQTILQALQQAGGSYLEAAKILGIHPNSLLRLMRNLNVKASMKAGQPPSRDFKK
ncbi:MAG TPA: sigma-54-dependent Fis family transcriptional regulator, partial [Candidatus Acidoferrum sp.]|nr:sigma-54-dependent Fis family transcriptional regulator [Candidatus Acidoferrum sp.]